MTHADVAYRAAEIIAERGLCKYKPQDEEGRVCLWMALTLAAGEDASLDKHPVASMISEILIERDELPWVAYGFSLWNDDRDTSQEDVILLLKETAERLSRAG